MEVFYVEEQNVKAHRPCICFKVLGVAGKMLNEVLNLAKSHRVSVEGTTLTSSVACVRISAAPKADG